MKEKFNFINCHGVKQNGIRNSGRAFKKRNKFQLSSSIHSYLQSSIIHLYFYTQLSFHINPITVNKQAHNNIHSGRTS